MPKLGDEHNTEITEDYLDNLSLHWPHPREQLHIGGWEATYKMVEDLGLDTANHILDICCGEGGTGRWLAKTYQRRVKGVDILPKAIKYAQDQAKVEGVTQLVEFKQANVMLLLPFEDEEFDVIYGQDPDGFAHYGRVKSFKECLRVLRPKGVLGFQHWLLHDDTPRKYVDQLETLNSELGFPSMSRLTVHDYVSDLTEAGFHNITNIDLSEMYIEHHQAIERNAGSKVGIWVKLLNTLAEKGVKFGVLIRAEKP